MRSREKAFTPWVSVPRKPRASRRTVLCTQVARRRKAGRPSTDPAARFEPTTMSASPRARMGRARS